MSKVMAVLRSFTEKDFKEIIGLSLLGIIACMLFQPTAFAYAGDLDGVLKGVGTAASIVGGIILVVVLVKGIADYIKGEGTIGKIVVKVLCILLLIGLIVVATNIKDLQDSMGQIASSGVDVVTDTATEVLGD